jgi:hypothetical protein
VFDQAPEAARSHMISRLDHAWALHSHGTALMARARMQGRAAGLATADRKLACASLRRSLQQLDLREKQFPTDARLVGDGQQLKQALTRDLPACK